MSVDLQKGLFIVFEGAEGAGKTTQTQLLSDSLRRRGLDVDVTREPGGTPLGERVRRLLLNEQEMQTVYPRVQVLLVSAARAQHVSQRIRPQLDRGGVVICDRFTGSTQAYQGAGFRMSRRDIERIGEFSTDGVRPDLTVLLDLDVQDGLKRSFSHRDTDWEKAGGINWHGIDFHERVRESFLSQARENMEQWLVADANAPLAMIASDILDRVGVLIDSRELRQSTGLVQRSFPMDAT